MPRHLPQSLKQRTPHRVSLSNLLSTLSSADFSRRKMLIAGGIVLGAFAIGGTALATRGLGLLAGSSQTIYIVSENDVYAVHADDGSLVWRYRMQSLPLDPSILVVNEVLYTVSLQEDITALRVSDGSLLWQQHHTVGNYVPIFTVVNGSIYMYSNNTLFVLDALDGTLFWQYQAGGISTPPVVSQQIVYFGSYDNSLYALQASNGALLWRYQTGNTVGACTVVNGVAYVCSFDHTIYALNANSGTSLWNYTMNGASWSSPCVVNGVVYVGTDSNDVYALNIGDGSLLWQYQADETVMAALIVIDGIVYVSAGSGTSDQYVYTISANNGSLLWKYQTGVANASSHQGWFPLTVIAGTLYITSQDNSLYAIQTE